MKESTIRQVITGIIHGDRVITKESSVYATCKGKEVMEFLKENNLLYGNFIPEPPKDTTPDNPIPSERTVVCMTCTNRAFFDENIDEKNHQRYCKQCGIHVPGPRLRVDIKPDTNYSSGTKT
jgi:hypothetical protein